MRFSWNYIFRSTYVVWNFSISSVM